MIFLWLCGDSVGEDRGVPIDHLLSLQHLDCNHISLTFCLKNWFDGTAESIFLGDRPTVISSEVTREVGAAGPFPGLPHGATLMPFPDFSHPCLWALLSLQGRKRNTLTNELFFFVYLKLLQKVPVFVTYSKWKNSLWKVGIAIVKTAF